MIEILKGVPMPPTRANGSNSELWRALLAVSIGDSFVLPKKLQSRVTLMARAAGIRVATRTLSDTKIRVWRIE